MRSSSPQSSPDQQPACTQDHFRPHHPGRGSGSLTVIGLGPGHADLLAPWLGPPLTRPRPLWAMIAMWTWWIQRCWQQKP